MDRLDIWIVSVLEYNGADNYLVAMSIGEILQEEHDTTRISLYKHLKKLVKKNYVANGPRDNKADSYYITGKGQEALVDVREWEGSGC